MRCVAPDHVGMGLSEKPADYDYTPRGADRRRRGPGRGLGLRRVHLVVHDWGGPIGLGFAGRHPERVGRIAILNTAAFALGQDPGADSALPRAPGSAPCWCAG